MPQHLSFTRPFSAAALLGMAGLGASLGAGPALPAPGWHSLVGLAAGAAAAAWLGRRDHLMRRRFAALRLQVEPLPAAPQTLAGVVRFASTAPLAWCARQGEWCLDLARTEADDLPWQLDLRRAGPPDAPVRLAQAATLDAVLTLSRRLFTGQGMAQADDPALREAAGLLDCDLEFVLPAPQGRITALAEGGYALHDARGSHALCAVTANALLGEVSQGRSTQA
ncbi:hypothetical protein E0493_19805 [Roseomonas sp. M0104]|uniref:Uncharacterized protein n=1 Tax=Teichococcus coralli TaxID=2545983 RepID=A0A845BJY2_9PROT|nr:hypothetical protein [Pseudoroseomonas coralli]MXP65597.1 hypothetical protein [Pseudoroseomonas coralli]